MLKFIIGAGLIFISLATSAQMPPKLPLHYYSRTEVITITSIDEGYTSTIEFHGILPKRKKRTIKIPFHETRQIDAIKAVCYGESIKPVKLPKGEITRQTDDISSFYGSSGRYSFKLGAFPDTVLFRYTYRERGTELMYKSLLPLNHVQSIDSIVYEVVVPEHLQLRYTIAGDRRQLISLSVDSTEDGDHTIYTFLAQPGKKVFAHEHNQLVSVSKTPAVQLSIFPASFHHETLSFFDEWYYNHVTENSSLDPGTIEKFNAVLSAATSAADSVKLIYAYVRSQIKTVAFDDGLPVTRFRDINSLITRKETTAKDYANLFTHIFNYYGFDAYNGLVTTISHPYNTRFPALSSYDHVVCVIRKNPQEWYYLDASDPVAIFDRPGKRIQGSTIHLVDGLGGSLIKVPSTSGISNRIEGQFEFRRADVKLNGDYRMQFNGSSQWEIATTHEQYDDRHFNLWLSEYLATYASKVTFNDYATEKNDTSFMVEGSLNCRDVFMEINGQTFFFLSFLPFPHNYPYQLKDHQELVLFHPINNVMDVRISFPEAVSFQSLEPVTFEEQGLRFTFTPQQLKPDLIHLQYSFSCDQVRIDHGTRAQYNKVNRLMNHTLQQQLILE